MSQQIGKALAGRAGMVTWFVIIGVVLGAVRVLTGGVPAAAHSEVIVGQPVTVQSLTATNPGGVDQARLVDAQSRILSGERMHTLVEKQLPKNTADFTAHISTSPNSNVLGIDVTSDSPSAAKAAANQYARSYVQLVERQNLAAVDRAASRLEAQLAQLDTEIAATRGVLAGTTVGDASAAGAEGATLSGQRLALQNRLAQVELARTVDPAGGASVVDRATDAERSLTRQVGTVVGGGVLGFLLALLIGAALTGLASRRQDEGTVDEALVEDTQRGSAPETPADARVEPESDEHAGTAGTDETTGATEEKELVSASR